MGAQPVDRTRARLRASHEDRLTVFRVVGYRNPSGSGTPAEVRTEALMFAIVAVIERLVIVIAAPQGIPPRLFFRAHGPRGRVWFWPAFRHSLLADDGARDLRNLVARWFPTCVSQVRVRVPCHRLDCPQDVYGSVAGCLPTKTIPMIVSTAPRAAIRRPLRKLAGANWKVTKCVPGFTTVPR